MIEVCPKCREIRQKHEGMMILDGMSGLTHYTLEETVTLQTLLGKSSILCEAVELEVYR